MFDKAEKMVKSALDAKVESATSNLEKIKEVCADMLKIRELEDSYHKEFLEVVSGYSSTDIMKKYL